MSSNITAYYWSNSHLNAHGVLFKRELFRFFGARKLSYSGRTSARVGCAGRLGGRPVDRAAGEMGVNNYGWREPEGNG